MKVVGVSRRHGVLGLAACIFAGSAVLVAQRTDVFVDSRDHPAIRYSMGAVTDAVSTLNARIAAGDATLTSEPASGYLRSVLTALKVPVESQTLVFSQGSLQGSEITMLNPRAIYFNDSVAVGWVRGSDTLEVAAQDPRQGTIFYTVNQKAAAGAKFTRDDNTCLTCHLSWDNLGVPGLMTMSMFPLPDDKNAYANGFNTDHRSPKGERWGGWYVTGRHGGGRHMGNVPVMPVDKGRSKIANSNMPLDSVKGLFDLAGYPTPYSDIVALMVLNHQTLAMNMLTRLGWEARLAERTRDTSRMNEAVKALVDYFLFVDEAQPNGRVHGTAGFAEYFPKLGPRDAKGRSLRDFDLERRLFRYPMSYMIYSAAFDSLPVPAKAAVYRRFWAVLSGTDTAPLYKRLLPADRQAVIDILRETKKDLPVQFTS